MASKRLRTYGTGTIAWMSRGIGSSRETVTLGGDFTWVYRGTLTLKELWKYLIVEFGTVCRCWPIFLFYIDGKEFLLEWINHLGFSYVVTSSARKEFFVR